jgi:hypothetical protein
MNQRGDVMKPFALGALATVSLVLLGACDQAPERPAQPNLQATFDRADANRDGVIEQKEATSIANRSFAEVDTDDDQVVSIDEFEVALKSQESPRG